MVLILINHLFNSQETRKNSKPVLKEYCKQQIDEDELKQLYNQTLLACYQKTIGYYFRIIAELSF